MFLPKKKALTNESVTFCFVKEKNGDVQSLAYNPLQIKGDVSKYQQLTDFFEKRQKEKGLKTLDNLQFPLGFFADGKVELKIEFLEIGKWRKGVIYL